MKVYDDFFSIAERFDFIYNLMCFWYVYISFSFSDNQKKI